MSVSPNPPRPAETSSGDIELLRVRHQVRRLEPQEEGFPIASLPAGVHGFTSAPGHDQIPVFAKKTYHTFEVHKTADGTVHLIGFVTGQEAADLAAGKEGAGITLFPDPWETSQCLVSVPLARLVPARRALPREAGNPFPFTTA